MFQIAGHSRIYCSKPTSSFRATLTTFTLLRLPEEPLVLPNWLGVEDPDHVAFWLSDEVLYVTQHGRDQLDPQRYRAQPEFALLEDVHAAGLRRTYQAPTLARKAAPAVQLATKTCMIRGMNEGVKTTSQKSVMTARMGVGSILDQPVQPAPGNRLRQWRLRLSRRAHRKPIAARASRSDGSSSTRWKQATMRRRVAAAIHR